MFSTPERAARAGVAFGDEILDLAVLAEAGLVEGPFAEDSLNAFLQRGPSAWRETRARLQTLVRENRVPNVARVAQADARLHLPVQVGDYVDFYSSIEHASNVGKLFRPGGEPLTPNYRWMPIGYHGRSASVSVEREVRRPFGQLKDPSAGSPRFAPSAQLDFELELGFIVGRGNAGRAVAAGDAANYLFGAVLLCDWSARDVQSWEAQPLGPFLSKSFATTISPWIVTLDALQPYRVANCAQEPSPLPYLHVDSAWAFDIELTAGVQTAAMRAKGEEAEEVTRVNFRDMYWNVAQQLAHLTSNGSIVRPGDLLGSGTISGIDPGTYGSLLEATLRGTRPLSLRCGETRSFLEDGDTVVMRGWCAREGLPNVGFGELRATIVSAG